MVKTNLDLYNDLEELGKSMWLAYKKNEKIVEKVEKIEKSIFSTNWISVNLISVSLIWRISNYMPE